MLFGHNSNVKVGETTFHVQTEDRGVTTALIDTTVYFMGRVMHRRTNNYHDLVPLDADREEALRLRLDEQHRSTLEDIRSGVLYLAPPPSVRPGRTATNAVVEQISENNSADTETLPAPPSTMSGLAAASAPSTAAHANAIPSANGSNAHGGANKGEGADELADPIPSPLKLELRNARTWLSGKQASLEIAVTNPSGEPLSGAKVLAYIEGAATAEQYPGETDASGHAQITFAMPRLSGAPAALVIEAWRAHGEPMSRATLHGKVRFALRTKPRPA
ncbi:MAG: hypothetical protein ABSG69_15960 [Candidatus Acidiferrum sp.]|jgi:hypothetical protein